MKNNNKNYSTGIGFTGLLTIVFIALKLIGIINWSWLWVLSPIWINVVVVVLILVIAYVCIVIKETKGK
jgi:hypothetical protein